MVTIIPTFDDNNVMKLHVKMDNLQQKFSHSCGKMLFKFLLFLINILIYLFNNSTQVFDNFKLKH